VSAWLFVGMLVAAIVFAITTPAPPTGGGTATLDYIAGHRTLYIVHQQLWLARISAQLVRGTDRRVGRARLWVGCAR